MQTKTESGRDWHTCKGIARTEKLNFIAAAVKSIVGATANICIDHHTRNQRSHQAFYVRHSHALIVCMTRVISTSVSFIQCVPGGTAGWFVPLGTSPRSDPSEAKSKYQSFPPGPSMHWVQAKLRLKFLTRNTFNGLYFQGRSRRNQHSESGRAMGPPAPWLYRSTLSQNTLYVALLLFFKITWLRVQAANATWKDRANRSSST